jgi:DNA polymerase III subunit gamma/tau
MNLALKYRPKQFSDVAGQRAVCVMLQAMIQKQKLSQVLLFTGASGVGKTSMARIVAAQLNSEAAEDVFAGTHPAVLEIDAASNGSVERIRNLRKDTAYAVPGHRVVIMDEIHAISDQGFTALLNLLEFPPPNVTFILITTEAHRAPKTIRHRSDRYNFKQATEEELFDRLVYVKEQEGFDISDDLLNLLASRAEGSYREAIMLLDQVTTADITTVEAYNELQGDIDYGPLLLKSALSGPISAISQLEIILRYTNTEEIADRTVEVLTELLVLKGGQKLQYSGKALEIRLELVAKLTPEQILKSMKLMWDLQTKLSAGNPVRGLEMAFSLMGEVLNTSPQLTAPAVSTKMSLQDMQRFTK